MPTATCGFCKATGVPLIRSKNGQDEGKGLETHTIPTTIQTECKGYETYRNLGSDGRTSRSSHR